MIHTLIPDIYDLVKRKDGWFTDELAADFSTELSKRLQVHFGTEKATPSLRLSKMGPTCPKALWHSVHTPLLAEPLPAWAEIKLSYGHMIEAQAIALAKASGHSVTGEQDAVSVDGIVGHRDCVIDGAVVDVKSCNSRSFQRFKSKGVSDDWGYLSQLDGYIVGSREDPLVSVKDRGYILAIDKVLGHMLLYEHRLREEHIRERIENYKSIVAQDRPPDCRCKTQPYGQSGNIGLDTKASYNLFKYCCFPHLRTFLYATPPGPVYLTKVVRKPDVPEVDRHGKIVYN